MKTNERSKCRLLAGWLNRPSWQVAARLAVVCLVAVCWTGPRGRCRECRGRRQAGQETADRDPDPPVDRR